MPVGVDPGVWVGLGTGIGVRPVSGTPVPAGSPAARRPRATPRSRSGPPPRAKRRRRSQDPTSPCRHGTPPLRRLGPRVVAAQPQIGRRPRPSGCVEESGRTRSVDPFVAGHVTALRAGVVDLRRGRRGAPSGSRTSTAPDVFGRVGGCERSGWCGRRERAVAGRAVGGRCLAPSARGARLRPLRASSARSASSSRRLLTAPSGDPAERAEARATSSSIATAPAQKTHRTDVVANPPQTVEVDLDVAPGPDGRDRRERGQDEKYGADHDHGCLPVAVADDASPVAAALARRRRSARVAAVGVRRRVGLGSGAAASEMRRLRWRQWTPTRETARDEGAVRRGTEAGDPR